MARSSGEQLRRVLDGWTPMGGRSGTSSSPVKVAGYDLTFSAPKSVSVLFGLGGPEVREAVRRAHDKAVRGGDGACGAHGGGGPARPRRPGRGAGQRPGGRACSGTAPRGSGIRSCTPTPSSRTWAAARTAAGRRWMAGGSMRRRGRRASSTRPCCASELSRELGVRVDGGAPRDRRRSPACPKPVLRAFSRRRAEIEAELERHGTSGPAASEAAALATRAPQGPRRSARSSLRRNGVSAPQELGLRPRAARGVLGRARGREAAVEWERLFDVLASPAGLTQVAVDVRSPRRHPGAVRAAPGRRGVGRAPA